MSTELLVGNPLEFAIEAGIRCRLEHGNVLGRIAVWIAGSRIDGPEDSFVNGAKHWCGVFIEGRAQRRIQEFDSLTPLEILDLCRDVSMEGVGPVELTAKIASCDLTVIGLEECEWEVFCLATAVGKDRIVWRRSWPRGRHVANEAVLKSGTVDSVAGEFIRQFDAWVSGSYGSAQLHDPPRES